MPPRHSAVAQLREIEQAERDAWFGFAAAPARDEAGSEEPDGEDADGEERGGNQARNLPEPRRNPESAFPHPLSPC